MRRAKITEITKPQHLKKMFRSHYDVELWNSDHNPFLQSTEYEIHLTNNQYDKNPYSSMKHHYTVKLTVAWAENGYRYKSLKQLSNMIKRDFPHHLI